MTTTTLTKDLLLQSCKIEFELTEDDSNYKALKACTSKEIDTILEDWKTYYNGLTIKEMIVHVKNGW